MLELITDRSAADVSRWRELRNKGWGNMTEAERSEWLSPMKGAYNHTDLNRVGAALNYIRDRLSGRGYLPPNAFAARVDWAEGEVPTLEDLTKYIGYVSTVREVSPRFTSTPPAPQSATGLSYQEANDIEQIIFDVDLMLSNMRSLLYYSGDLYSGEL